MVFIEIHTKFKSCIVQTLAAMSSPPPPKKKISTPQKKREVLVLEKNPPNFLFAQKFVVACRQGLPMKCTTTAFPGSEVFRNNHPPGDSRRSRGIEPRQLANGYSPEN